jgi:hypothetical protein
MSLPEKVRVLTYITSPVMMSPVVLHLYTVILHMNDLPENILQAKFLITSLKMGELALESIPQLATQWFAVSVIGGFGLLKSGVFRGATTMQAMSIATSTITIGIDFVSWLMVSRRQQFFSSEHNSATSMLPLFLWLMMGIVSGTT